MYVPVDADLVNHHRLRGLARDMLGTPHHILGHLVGLWAWALSNAEDGDLSDFDAHDIADGSGISMERAEEWLGALKKRGWVTEDNKLHAWDRHAGKTLKAKEKEARRKA